MMQNKTKSEVLEKLKQILTDSSGIEEISIENDLKDDLALDSLDITEIIMECEKEFHISIEDVEYDGISTVGQLLDVVYAKMN
jgi:acyl carrier protein